MKIIPNSKIELYLKLNRKLAQFIKIDYYFESKTFDWIKLEKYNNNYKARLIRSFDEGDEVFNNVLEFSTVNEIDNNTNYFFVGSLEEIKEWVKKEFKTNLNQLCLLENLKWKYIDLVNNNELGQQLNNKHHL